MAAVSTSPTSAPMMPSEMSNSTSEPPRRGRLIINCNPPQSGIVATPAEKSNRPPPHEAKLVAGSGICAVDRDSAPLQLHGEPFLLCVAFQNPYLHELNSAS